MLPANYEEGLAELVVPLIAQIEDRLREDPDAIEKMLVELLCRSDFDEREGVIKSAESGDPLAHSALVRVYKEMRDRSLDPPRAIETYVLRHLDSDPPKRRGRHITSAAFGAQPVSVGFIRRDLTLALLICLTTIRLNLRPTRSSASDKPSAASVVSLALKRRNRNLWISEKRLNNLYTQWGRIAETSVLQWLKILPTA
jgi:hypothetical protein